MITSMHIANSAGPLISVTATSSRMKWGQCSSQPICSQYRSFYIPSNEPGPGASTWSSCTGMKDYLDYISRNQYVLQQGRPQVDLALYLYETQWSAVDLLHSNNITAAGRLSLMCFKMELTLMTGYTYDYVAPNNLVSPQATVRAKVLAPDGPNYKTLVFCVARI